MCNMYLGSGGGFLVGGPFICESVYYFIACNTNMCFAFLYCYVMFGP